MKDYLQIIEDNREEMLRTLKEIVAIPSIVSEADGDSPFGKEVQRALDFALEMGIRDGFDVKNADNYGGHIEFKGKTEDVVAVVGHLDVVPAGDLSNWKTDPFIAEIDGGKMYGRGTIDDKGPFIAGYYAMKALKQAGFEPTKSIRVILGLDEETEWKGMEYYMKKEKPKVVSGFSPDAEFPAIHAEKGLIIFDIVRKRGVSCGGQKNKVSASHGGTGIKLISLSGGTVANAVADGAEAVIMRGDKMEEIKVKGVTAHAAYPELGLNAISLLMELLGGIEFDSEETNSLIAFYNEYIGFNLHGEKVGACLEDEPSGNLAFNVGIAKVDEEEARFTVNIRYPVTFDVEDVYSGMEKVLRPLGYTIEKVDYQPPLYKAADDPLIVTLMETYSKFTGDHESKPLVIGGATYARAVPNTVAFGPVMPGKPDMCHQANEYVDIEDLITSTKIFAEALYKLAR